MQSYTLKESKQTGELHLFEGVMNPAGSEHICTSNLESICKKMAFAQNKANKFTCKTEQEARDLSAKIGRAVCGTCISHLYADYQV